MQKTALHCAVFERWVWVVVVIVVLLKDVIVRVTATEVPPPMTLLSWQLQTGMYEESTNPPPLHVRVLLQTS
jgi:hypothetical protein